MKEYDVLFKDDRELAKKQKKLSEKQEKLQEYKKYLEDEIKSGTLWLEGLDLSTRAYNCLKRSGIYELNSLSHMTYNEFQGLKNIGPSINEIISKMQEYGISFKEELEEDKEPEIKEAKEIEEEETEFRLEDLGLSTRAYNCLKRSGIYELNSLSHMTYNEFQGLKNIGPSINEIISKMQEYGISFKEELEEDKEPEIKETKEIEEEEKIKTEETGTLEDMTIHELQEQIKDNNEVIAKNDNEIKQETVGVLVAQQDKIKSQQAEIANLKSQRRDKNGE